MSKRRRCAVAAARDSSTLKVKWRYVIHGENKSFLICFSQHDFCAIADGPDAAAAVRDCYGVMDGSCGPADEAAYDQEPMDVYENPGAADADVARLSAVIESGDYTGCMQLFAVLYPDRQPIDIGGRNTDLASGPTSAAH